MHQPIVKTFVSDESNIALPAIAGQWWPPNFSSMDGQSRSDASGWTRKG
jgi:hypothetical protein